MVPVFALLLLGVGTASAHGWFGGFSNATPEEIAQRQQTMFQNQADLLGINADVIKNGWADGKTIPEIAEGQGISADQLRERMEAARKERMQEELQAMVDNGIITQEQADKRFKVMEERFADGEFGRMNRGPHRGFGGGCGF